MMSDTNIYLYQYPPNGFCDSRFAKLFDAADDQVLVFTATKTQAAWLKMRWPSLTVCVFDSFLSQEASIRYRPLDLMVVRDCLQASAQLPALWERVKEKPGFVERVLTHYLERKRECAPMTGVFLEIDKAFFERGLVDSADLYAENQDLGKSALKDQVLGKQLLFFGFYSMNGTQKKVLQALYEWAAQLSVGFCFEPNTFWSEAAQSFLDWLDQAFPCRHLPAPNAAQFSMPTLIAAANQTTLLYRVVADIKLASSQGLPLSGMAVIVSDAQQRQLLLRTLSEAGVPVAGQENKVFSDLPAVLSLVQLLAFLVQPSKQGLLVFASTQFCPKQIKQFCQLVLPGLPAFDTIKALLSQLQDQGSAFADVLAWLSKLAIIPTEDELDFEQFWVLITTLLSSLSALPDDQAEFIQALDSKLRRLSTSIYGDVSVWLGHLELSLSQLPLTEALGVQDGCWVLEASEAFGLELEKVFFLGNHQKAWPKLSAPCLFLAEKDRERLGMTTQRQQVLASQYLWVTLALGSGVVTLFQNQSISVRPHVFLSMLATYLSQPIAAEWVSQSPGKSVSVTLSEEETSFSEKQLGLLKGLEQLQVFSATQLELFQACPYQFFVRDVLRVRPRQALSQDVAASDWGTFIHDLLKRFYEELAMNQQLGFLEKDLAPLLQHLEELAESMLKEQRATLSASAWENRRQALFGSSRKKGLLRRFLETELESRAWITIPFRPKLLEKPFGPIPLTDGQGRTVSIRGAIDVALADPEAYLWMVLDYKTSKALPTGADLKSYKSLQLPLYQLALRHLIDRGEVVGAMYFQLAFRGAVEKKVVMLDEASKKTGFDLGRKRPLIQDNLYFQGLVSHVNSLKAMIMEAAFSPQLSDSLPTSANDRKTKCQYCDYKAMCSYGGRHD